VYNSFDNDWDMEVSHKGARGLRYCTVSAAQHLVEAKKACLAVIEEAMKELFSAPCRRTELIESLYSLTTCEKLIITSL
jgi:hypothetical protein